MSQSDTTVKKLQVVLTGNTAQLQQAMNQAQAATDKATTQIQSGLNKVDSAFKSIAKAAATYISVRTLVNFGKQCVELGSDLTEVQNVVDVTFGKMSSKIDEFAKSAITQFGLSETAAKRYSSTMGSMLKSMGMSTDQAYDMSTTLAGLAGDIASFYNLSADDAFAKIRSGISGQTEPLKQLGINLSVANMEAYAMSQGITKSYSAMTQAEQTLLRYNYLLTATADAQGDFSRTSDSWANQVKILRMNFESLKATLGQGLIMALLPAIKLINQLMERLQELAEGFKYFMSVITGADYDAMAAATSTALTDDLSTASEMAVSTSDSVDSISDSLKNASAEARKFLFSFDEIHALQGDDSNNDSLSGTEGLNTDINSNFQPIDEIVTDNALNGIDEANKKLNNMNNSFGLTEETKKKIENVANEVKKVVNAIKDPVEDAVDVVVDEVKGDFQTVKGVAKVYGGIVSENEDMRAEGGMDLMEGIDNRVKGLGTAVAWFKEHILGQKNATEDFRKEWEEKSPLQRQYDFGSQFGNMTGPQQAWQYIDPEKYKRMQNNGGKLTEEDAVDIFDQHFNQTGDWQYTAWWAKQTGETAFGLNNEEVVDILSDIRDEWAELEAIEHQGEVYGNTDIPNNFNEDNPVVVAPTIDEYKDACKEGIREALDERQPTNITIEMSGREVGYGVADAMAVENVQFNPEVAVV